MSFCDVLFLRLLWCFQHLAVTPQFVHILNPNFNMFTWRPSNPCETENGIIETNNLITDGGSTATFSRAKCKVYETGGRILLRKLLLLEPGAYKEQHSQFLLSLKSVVWMIFMLKSVIQSSNTNRAICLNISRVKHKFNLNATPEIKLWQETGIFLKKKKNKKWYNLQFTDIETHSIVCHLHTAC